MRLVRALQGLGFPEPCLNLNLNMQGLDALTPGMKHGGLARPRRFDIGAALYRLRSVHMEQA